MIDRRAVLVERQGAWLPGHVLWTYDDIGRERALVHYDTAAGLTLRELRWSDELRRPRCLVLQLSAGNNPGGRHGEPDCTTPSLVPDSTPDRDDWSGIRFRAG